MTKSTSIVAFFLLCVLTPDWHLRANGQDEELPPDLLEIMRNSQPSFMVRVEVDRPSCSYREGDTLTIRVGSEKDAYVYVFYQPADGETYQVFPNRFQPNNLVKARQAVRVPAEDDLFRWRVSAPFGKEKIKVIATRKELQKLSVPALTRSRFNHVSPQVFKGIELELGDDAPTEWAEDDVVVHTYGNQETPDLSASRRWGVFFGVSKHRYANHIRIAKSRAPDDDLLKQLHDTGGDLAACHRDAQKLANIMQEVGRLDGMRIFTNDNVTKQAMADAITRWLPAVSRPGDTVFIYYSGHTGQIDDISGDERDGKDEYIVPHDAFGFNEWYACKTLTARKQELLADGTFNQWQIENIESLYLRGEKEMKAHGSLDRFTVATCVTDDLMAHWLQRLAGRQIVFVSDTCHGAGFAHDEPTAPTRGARHQSGFDLLQNEARRLKELGQENQALLTAAWVGEKASELDDKSMGVMTHFLVQSLTSSPGSLQIEQAFEFCETNMEQYYAKLQQEGTHPFLLNNCRLPVYVKP